MQKNKKQKTKAKKKEKVEWSGHPFWPNVGDPLWSDWGGWTTPWEMGWLKPPKSIFKNSGLKKSRVPHVTDFLFKEIGKIDARSFLGQLDILRGLVVTFWILDNNNKKWILPEG